MIQLEIQAFDDHNSSRICFTASTLPTWWRHVPPSILIKTVTGFWGRKPENHSSMVLRLQPPNLPKKRIYYATSTISTCVTVILLTPRSLSPSAPLLGLGQPMSWLGQTVYSSHVLLLIDIPKCQPPALSLLAILVSRSKPHVCPSQHNTSLLDFHYVHRLSLCSTPTHQHNQEKFCICTHVMVNLQTQPKSRLFSTITHHKLGT